MSVGNVEKKDFTTMMQERQERRINLAKERNSRVMIVRSNDTHELFNIATSIDKAMRRLRDGMGLQYSFEDGELFIKEYNNILYDFNDYAKRICKLTNIKYKEPKIFKKKEQTEKETEKETENQEEEVINA